ncbi:MAG: sigma-70 family RNA polymerase sigma factor [Chloroflexi bacterium]|nr:sigma-70 family RNA polymerase sigma factor [Chloroflexota bacterium]
MNENELIGASQAGDTPAFNQLVVAYQTQVYNLAYRMLSEPESAADATQEAFLSAYRHIRQFRGGSFRAWLLRIATNACYDELRRRRRSPQAASLDQAMDEEGTPEPPDRDPTPEEAVLHRDLQQHLQRGLAGLPYEQRVVVVLSDVQGLSYEDIAEVTNASLGTVKSRLSRGRAHLRDFLERSGELSPAPYRHD